jgi:nucleotide-binding universal stress UspA family protein
MKPFSNIYFKNVLWATDGKNENKLVLQRVLAVIKKFNSSLTLVHVIDEPPLEMAILSGKRRSEISNNRNELLKLQVKKSQSSLEKIVATLKKNGVRANFKVVTGKEFIEIIRLVLRNKHDLVLKKAGMDDGFLKRAFGNEDMHLMRDCPCPVLLIKPKVRKDHPLILAAVDPDPVNSTRDAINRMIVDYTLSIEQSFKKCEIHFIHAWDINEGIISKVGGQAEIKAMGYRERQHRRELVDAFLDNYNWDNNRPKIHILKGNPKILIPKLAKDLNAGLVIMGTICRTGIPGLIIGNTAETVMNKLDCSIMAIKPQNFVSNVTLKKIKSY